MKGNRDLYNTSYILGFEGFAIHCTAHIVLQNMLWNKPITGSLMVKYSTKIKKKLHKNWGTSSCEIKTIYIKEYFKVDGAAYTDDLRLKYKPKRGSLQAEWSI